MPILSEIDLQSAAVEFLDNTDNGDQDEDFFVGALMHQFGITFDRATELFWHWFALPHWDQRGDSTKTIWGSEWFAAQFEEQDVRLHSVNYEDIPF